MPDARKGELQLWTLIEFNNICAKKRICALKARIVTLEARTQKQAQQLSKQSARTDGAKKSTQTSKHPLVCLDVSSQTLCFGNTTEMWLVKNR